MPLAGTRLAPVVPKLQKIICLGHNYLSHIKEMGAEPPSHPTLFAKFARCLIGPRDPIVLPAVSQSVDWEAELAFVIGREVRHGTHTVALPALCVYSALNAISSHE